MTINDAVNAPVRCGAVRRNGQACTTPALGPGRQCFAHDAALLAKRREASGRGGRNRSFVARARRWANGDLLALEEDLQQLMRDVRDKKLRPDEARAICAAAQQIIAIAHFRLENVETREIAEKIDDLRRELSGTGAHAG